MTNQWMGTTNQNRWCHEQNSIAEVELGGTYTKNDSRALDRKDYEQETTRDRQMELINWEGLHPEVETGSKKEEEPVSDHE